MLHVTQLTGFGGSVPASAAFGAVSTIAAMASDSGNANFPAGIAANDLIVIWAVADAGVGNTVDSWTTPSGFSVLATSGIGNRRSAAAFYKVASGSESGTLAVACVSSGTAATGAVDMARYRGGAAVSPVDGAASNSGASTSAAPSSLTPSQDGSLAVALIAGHAATTVTAISGMSGGTWSESAAEQTSGAFVLDAQSASMPIAGTISGGSATLGTSTTWYVFTFAIKPA